MKALDIYVGARLAGKLFKLGEHEYIFKYTTSEPEDFVSLTMPVRVRDYETQVLHPIFQMNLPEGFNLEVIRGKFAKLLELDDIDLLAMVGGRPIGRVRAARPGKPPSSSAASVFDDKALMGSRASQELLDHLIDQYVPEQGVSGVQPKVLLPLSKSSQRERKAVFATPTHIYKSSREHEGLSVNEYFCLRAAAAAGLPVPANALSRDGEVLRVRRFDGDAQGQAIGFEEAVVLRGLSRHGKYQASLEELANSLKDFTDRGKWLAEAQKFFALVAFNVGVRNGDAHLKNFGLVYTRSNDAVLAPVYDVVTSTVYVPKDLMALSLQGSKDWPERAALLDFARFHCGIRPQIGARIVDRVSQAIRSTNRELSAYARDNPSRRKLMKRMRANWAAGLKSLEQKAG